MGYTYDPRPHMDNFIWALEVVEGFTIRVNDTSELGEAIVEYWCSPRNIMTLLRRPGTYWKNARG